LTSRHSNTRINDSRQRSWKFIAGSAAGGVALVAVVLGAVMWLGGSSDDPPARAAQPGDVDLSALTESTTHTTLDAAPADDRPAEATDGTVVHPRKPTAIFDQPGGEPIGKIGPRQLGDTWLPAIGSQDGWTRVLLPSKPNGSTGWLQTADVAESRTKYLIRVHLGARKLELLRGEKQIGEWSVGIGKPDTPTPTGRTFLLGSIVDPGQQFSPVILPLGSHSDTLDSFGGGPGTVAIHTWPSTEVFGTESSHGCIQVPEDALDHLKEVPLGTLVLVDQH